MKRPTPALLFLASLSFFAGLTPLHSAEEPLKVLTIGNSFANNATSFLSEIAQSENRSILIGRANLGGASLARHLKALDAYEKNPADTAGSPYTSRFTPPRNEVRKYSLPELLKTEKWDIVTIQQLSNLSHQFDSFEPHAGRLIEVIRQYAPQAEIVIHQTWAYREDYPGYKAKEFSKEKMEEGLMNSYRQLSQKYGLRIIPSGRAFQVATQSPRWQISRDPDFDYESPPMDAVPVEKGSLNTGWIWEADKATGVKSFKLDFKHANTAGKYLAGQVWFMTLFGADTSETSHIPAGLDPADAADLRRIARLVVQPKP
jgi:hypothetical protein